MAVLVLTLTKRGAVITESRERLAVAREVAQREPWASKSCSTLHRADVGLGLLVVARAQAVEVRLIDRRRAVGVRRQIGVGVGRHPGQAVVGQVVLVEVEVAHA